MSAAVAERLSGKTERRLVTAPVIAYEDADGRMVTAARGEFIVAPVESIAFLNRGEFPTVAPEGVSSLDDARSTNMLALHSYRAARGDAESAAWLTALASAAQPPPEAGIVDVSQAQEGGSPNEVAAYLRSASPSAQDTIALAGDDPVKARVVLEAEILVTDGSPRKGVATALRKIIESV